MEHFQQGGARCYFATTEDGKPCKIQRKPYTECFYVMALAELHRATGNQGYQVSGYERAFFPSFFALATTIWLHITHTSKRKNNFFILYFLHSLHPSVCSLRSSIGYVWMTAGSALSNYLALLRPRSWADR